MAELRSRINTEDTTTKVTPEEVEAIKEKTLVIMPAGGKGTRFFLPAAYPCFRFHLK